MKNKQVLIYEFILFISVILVISSCSSTERVHNVTLDDNSGRIVESEQEAPVSRSSGEFSEIPAVFFISGIVTEPVLAGDETAFVPVADVRIEIRDESRFLFAQATTGLNGRFFIEHRNIQPGREYFIMLVTRDRRGSDLITYDFKLHSEIEVVIDENFVSFRGADWDDRVLLRGSAVPPRTEQ